MNIDELIKLQREFDQDHFPEYVYPSPTNDRLSLMSHFVLGALGELGELANIIKKNYRGDDVLDISSMDVSSEVADVFIYLLKIADCMEINLEEAFLVKLDENRKRFMLTEED